MIAAWYDIFQGGSLRNYLGIRAHGGNGGGTQSDAACGCDWRTLGMEPEGGRGRFRADAPFDENAITLDWYDYLFKGKQNEFGNGKPVKIFVMGENKWRDEASWPLERAKETRYYLHSDGKANSAQRADGSLTTAAANKEAGG